MKLDEYGLPGTEFLYAQLGAAESFDDLALRAVRVCARKAHAEMCTFWSVYEEDVYEKGRSRRLRLAGAEGVTQIQTLAQEVTYAIGEGEGGTYDGITGFVATSRVPVRIASFEELKADYRFCHRGALDSIQWEGEAKTRFRNLYAVPLTLGNEVLGVLKVENRIGKEMFTAEDIAAVDSIGSAIAVIAKTLELLDIHERRLIDIPARLSEALLRPFDFSGLTKQIVQTTAKALNAKVCSLWLVDPTGRNLVHQANEGFAGSAENVPTYQIDLPADVKDEDISGITAWVAVRGRPFWANSHEQLRAHKSWRGRWDPIMWGGEKQAQSLFHSMYAAPLIWNKQVRGVLKVENPIGKAYFRPADHRMCDLMANYVALLLALTQQLRLQLVPDWAHILKSPAAHIKTTISALERELVKPLPDQSRMREYLDFLKASTASLWELSYTLSAEIKSAGIIKTAHPTKLAPILQEAVKMLQPLAPGAVKIEAASLLDPSIPLTDSEMYWVKVILFNLIHNAVKFSPAGGLVRVSCEQEASGETVIGVQDNGPGIPAEDLKRIFEPHFHRDKPGDEDGTGLGLATVSRLVSQLEWEVRPSNIASGGARFEVIIPANWRLAHEAKSVAG